MNRREFLKKSLEGIVISIILILNCSKNPVLEENIIIKDITPPVAEFTASPLSGSKPLEVSFDGSRSYDDESKITHYLWDFDGDGQGDSFEPVDKFVYQEVGTYHPNLTIINEAGLIISKDTSIVVFYQEKIDLEDIFIDKAIVADGFGNHDGIASEDELNFIDNYFKSNPEAWGMGRYPGYSYEDYEVTLSEVLEVFIIFKEGLLCGPYRSDAELRKKFEGFGIGGSVFGIYVFVQDNVISNQLRIKNCYCSGTGYISEHQWTPVIIKDTIANNEYVELSIKTGKDIYTWQQGESGKILHIQGMLENSSTNIYYSKVGDWSNSASEQDILFIAENSAGYLEKHKEADNSWYEVKNILGFLIEGSKFVSIKPSKLYFICASLSIKENEDEKGKYRFRIDYYDNENPEANTLPYKDYSNTFEIK